MSFIRSSWMLALGFAVATPVLAGTPVRREPPARHAHDPAPAPAPPAAPSFEGAWSAGSAPRTVHLRLTHESKPLPQPGVDQAVFVGTGGAVTLLDVEPAVGSRTQRPLGLRTLVDVDEASPAALRVASNPRKTLPTLGQGLPSNHGTSPAGTR